MDASYSLTSYPQEESHQSERTNETCNISLRFSFLAGTGVREEMWVETSLTHSLHSPDVLAQAANRGVPVILMKGRLRWLGRLLHAVW